MAKAKCTKCGGWAISDTYEKARKMINHAVALSRGKRCGDNYNKVIEIIDKDVHKIVKIIEKPTITKPTITKQTTTKKSKDTQTSQTKSFSN